MNTTTHADVLEHVMRLTRNEVDIVGFLDPSRPDRARVVGQLLRATNRESLEEGTPLHAWVYDTPLDNEWRTRVPHVPGSLWEQYRQLVALVGTPESSRDPYDALTQLLTRADGFFDAAPSPRAATTDGAADDTTN